MPNFNTWFLDEDFNRWCWEKNGKIFVYGLSNIRDNQINKSVNIVREVISKYFLPLEVLNGNNNNKHGYKILKTLVNKYINDNNEIEFNKLEKKLYKIRNDEKKLIDGIILLVDHSILSIKTKGSEYGQGSPGGLIIIRDIYNNKSTVVHEFGHMIGIGDHHSNCVMSYTGSDEEFCRECQDKIKRIWGG